MAKPEIKEKIGGFNFWWKEVHLKVSVTRIRQHRDSRVTGWLMFSSDAPGTDRLLHQSDFNFTSAETQKRLANALAARYEGYPWDDILEQLRYYILEKVRQGEPVRVLSTEAAEATPPVYLVDPLLPEEEVTTIFGDRGSAKSHIALLIYICLLLPWHDNPLGFNILNREQKRSIRPLILDYESNQKRIQWRAHKMQQGMGLPPFDVYYKRCVNPIPDDLEQVQIAIREFEAEVIIIDSLAQAAGGDIMKPEIAIAFFNAVRQLKVTPLIIAQTQKDPEKKVKTILGSGIYEYYSRNIWETRVSQTPGEDELHVALHHRKANESRLARPLAFRFYFNEDKTIITPEDIRTVAEFRSDLKTEERVLVAMQEISATATSELIADAADISVGQARTTLTRLKKKGKVYNFPDHTWGLAAPNY